MVHRLNKKKQNKSISKLIVIVKIRRSSFHFSTYYHKVQKTFSVSYGIVFTSPRNRPSGHSAVLFAVTTDRPYRLSVSRASDDVPLLGVHRQPVGCLDSVQFFCAGISRAFCLGVIPSSTRPVQSGLFPIVSIPKFFVSLCANLTSHVHVSNGSRALYGLGLFLR